MRGQPDAATARVFKNPTARERATGSRLRIEPPGSVAPQLAPSWWLRVPWFVYLVVAILLALIAVLIVVVS